MQNLNNVFKDLDVTMAKIKRPTSDFAKTIILSLLTESGYELTGNMIALPQELTGTHEHAIVNDHFPAICIMVAARKFFDCLVDATNEDSGMVFGMNDLLEPDPKRLRYFLSQFVNYWLVCNYYYEEFETEVRHVENKANSRTDLDHDINEYKKKNDDLKKSRATAAMKKEKLENKIAHADEKLKALSAQTQVLEEDKKVAKNNLLEAQNVAKTKMENERSVNKNALRLKSMAKADETKHELNTNLLRLGEDEEAKMIQVQEYKIKLEQHTDQEKTWKEVLVSFEELLKLMKQVKDADHEERAVISEGEDAHEHLEKLENHSNELKKIIEILRGDMAASKAKWEKTKVMKEADHKEYFNTFHSIQQQMTEDDMVSNELVDRYFSKDFYFQKRLLNISF